MLWLAIVQSLRVVAPLMPFLTEHLWQRLVADVDNAAPRSIHLAGWPDAAPRTSASKRSRRCAESSISGVKLARRVGSNCVSRCAGWSLLGPYGQERMAMRLPRSFA